MSPKSLLRHKLSVSTLSEVTEKGFQAVIDETDSIVHEDVSRVLLCSGKVYYDLLDSRRERELNNVAIIRVEQLYPFPEIELKKVLRHYPKMNELVWCQEEPTNQGAWSYISSHLTLLLKRDQQINLVARPASASPAVGYYQKHIEQLQTLVEMALRQA
jgi:2-oxoglutarate dehydrogenase E1 component